MKELGPCCQLDGEFIGRTDEGVYSKTYILDAKARARITELEGRVAKLEETVRLLDDRDTRNDAELE